MSLKPSYSKANPCLSDCKSKCTTWDVSPILPESNLEHYNYAIVILNRPIQQNADYIIPIWNNAAVRITVDGGTMKWETFLNKLEEDARNTMMLPDMITGDFDSISEEILARYKTTRSKIIHTPDQMHTDYTKALMVLDNHCQKKKLNLSFIVVLGQASGRIDQILANIQTLFLAREMKLFNENVNLFHLSDDAVSWLLSPGSHNIAIPKSVRENRRPWCSLVPIGDVCEQVTTQGLKWNLDNHCLKFGDLVSTSNTYSGLLTDTVKVECSQSLLWSMKLPILLDY